jgi:hypothetical protein
LCGQAIAPRTDVTWHETETMKDKYKSVYEKLQRIYQKHRRNHPENGDSEQMCCMWSTSDPPDIIEGTPPFDDIEDAFSISISDGVALELYDMHLDEAARKIMEMRNEQCRDFAAPDPDFPSTS